MKKKIVVVYYMTEETEFYEVTGLSTSGERVFDGRICKWYDGNEPVFQFDEHQHSETIACENIDGDVYDDELVKGFIKRNMEAYYKDWEIKKILRI